MKIMIETISSGIEIYQYTPYAGAVVMLLHSNGGTVVVVC